MTERTQVEVERLLRHLRAQFYAGGASAEKRFFQDRSSLLYALTWPADWLRYRSITWTADRYFGVLEELFAGIREHGATGEIRYFPGYLLKCVQDHFAHHSDDYCDEAKRTRQAFELALGRAISAMPRKPSHPEPNTVAILAEAHRVLALQRRGKKRAPQQPAQGDLFAP